MIAPLCSAIRLKAFGPADRIGLLSDQAALSRAGLLDPALYLQVGSQRGEAGIGWVGRKPILYPGACLQIFRGDLSSTCS
jgi:hypothetical protein